MPNSSRQKKRHRKKRKTGFPWIAKASIILSIILILTVSYFFWNQPKKQLTEAEKTTSFSKTSEEEVLSTSSTFSESSSKDSGKAEESTMSSEQQPTEEELEDQRIAKQMENTVISRPMTYERLDEGINGELLGKIICDKIGLNIDYFQGVGYETGSEWSNDPNSDDQRLLNACGAKKEQVLGQDNVVVAAHSAFYATPEEYFNPLLKTEAGTIGELDTVEGLMLKINDTIHVLQFSDNKEYKFRVSDIFLDDETGIFSKTIDAQGDIDGRPQLTLYVCADPIGNKRLVIQAELASISEA
ncbi:hypothetical protein IW492_04250 [Enterococcus sp. BWB1-3]|uniref:hypothetical protein n=1 Tax=unclassified Enterococcus TaxID=2608891 RepID=UPI0019205163|nr:MULTISPECIES: hypothetical protein [unclassified Enterococcus]MBL1228443.1 hypothetical protein [Enterococcus sp. BWB1-3]MCB5954330.1 hypothetical protein [Enterococcus sp. CWB-B31]